MKKVKILNKVLIAFFVAALAWSCVGNDEEIANVKTKVVSSIDATRNLSYIKDVTDHIKIGISPLGKSDPKQIESVVITKTFTSATLAEGITVDYKTITAIPDTLTLSMTDLLAGTGRTADQLVANDKWIFDYVVYLKDKTVLTPSFKSTITFTCESDLAGTYSYSTVVTGNVRTCVNPVTGTGTLTAEGGGVYKISDASFGQFNCAWSVNAATGIKLVDVCGMISVTGTDQYGLTYDYEIISNNGTTLVIKWSNDDGDAGTTSLTRTGDKTWPLGLRN